MDKKVAFLKDNVVKYITIVAPESFNEEFFSFVMNERNYDSYITEEQSNLDFVINDSSWNGTEFIPPKPYNSWIWNEQNKYWESPIPQPPIVENGPRYSWDEETVSWKEI